MVAEATYVLDVPDLKDVMDTNDEFRIGTMGIHDMTAFGEVHQAAVATILLEVGIVFVAQRAPQHADAQVLTPVELLDEGDTVENPTVEVPRHHERSIAVVHELHVSDEVERLRSYDVRLVGRRMDEQRIGHLAPLNASLEAEVELTPAAEPEALVDVSLREVVVVLTTHDSIEAHGMRNAEHRSILVDDTTTQLVVDVGLTRCIAQTCRDLRGLEEVAIARTTKLDRYRLVEGGEGHLATGLVLLTLTDEGSLEAPVSLVVEGHLLTVIEHHLVDLRPLECHHEVILIGIHKAVAG